MADENPYRSPDTIVDDDVHEGSTRRVRRFVRAVIYTHVLGLASTGFLSYLDMHQKYELMNSPLVILLTLPMFIGLFICPLFILVTMMSGRLRGHEAAVVGLAEVAIEAAQFFAMLPMC